MKIEGLSFAKINPWQICCNTSFSLPRLNVIIRNQVYLNQTILGELFDWDRFRAQICTNRPIILISKRFKFSGCFFPNVPMMQPTDPRQSDYLALAGRSGLYRPAIGRIFFKAQMRSVIMIIFEIRTKNACQVSFVQDDDSVRALSPDWGPLY